MAATISCSVRALDQLEPTVLTSFGGPSGVGNPRSIFISPDGQWVGFFTGPAMQKVAITGGPAVRITATDGQPRGATWGPDGTVIFATFEPGTGLQRVSNTGGEPTVLTRPDRKRGERDHWWPEFLPGGEAVLFTIMSGRRWHRESRDRGAGSADRQLEGADPGRQPRPLCGDGASDLRRHRDVARRRLSTSDGWRLPRPPRPCSKESSTTASGAANARWWPPTARSSTSQAGLPAPASGQSCPWIARDALHRCLACHRPRTATCGCRLMAGGSPWPPRRMCGPTMPYAQHGAG